MLNQAEGVAVSDQPAGPPIPQLPRLPQQRTQDFRQAPEAPRAEADGQEPVREPEAAAPGPQDQVPGDRSYVPWSPPPGPEVWPWGSVPQPGESPSEEQEPVSPRPSQDGEPVGEPAVPGQSAPPYFGWPPSLPEPPRSPVPEASGDAVGRRAMPLWRTEFQNARDMVDASPVGAVVTAWNALGVLALDACHASAVPLPASPRPVEIGEALRWLGLPPSVMSVFDRLRQLRNRAVHGVENVTPGAARDFVESCLTVARELDARMRG